MEFYPGGIPLAVVLECFPVTDAEIFCHFLTGANLSTAAIAFSQVDRRGSRLPFFQRDHAAFEMPASLQTSVIVTLPVAFTRFSTLVISFLRSIC